MANLIDIKYKNKSISGYLDTILDKYDTIEFEFDDDVFLVNDNNANCIFVSTKEPIAHINVSITAFKKLKPNVISTGFIFPYRYEFSSWFGNSGAGNDTNYWFEPTSFCSLFLDKFNNNVTYTNNHLGNTFFSFKQENTATAIVISDEDVKKSMVTLSKKKVIFNNLPYTVTEYKLDLSKLPLLPNTTYKISTGGFIVVGSDGNIDYANNFYWQIMTKDF